MLVKVIWRDITTIEGREGAWMDKDAIIERAKEVFDDDYITVGYVVEKNEDYLVIAATIDKKNDSYADVSMIPASVIKKIIQLNEKTSKETNT